MNKFYLVLGKYSDDMDELIYASFFVATAEEARREFRRTMERELQEDNPERYDHLVQAYYVLVQVCWVFSSESEFDLIQQDGWI